MKISRIIFCFLKRSLYDFLMGYTIILLVLLSTLASISLLAQSISPFSINPFGNVVTESNVMLSWTVGEICGTYQCQPGICLSEGFQQSTISIIGIEKQNNESKLRVSAFPNPVDNILQLQFQCVRPQKVVLQLFDVTGKICMESDFTREQGKSIYTFSVGGLPSQLLLLKITFPDEKISESFRIMKL